MAGNKVYVQGNYVDVHDNEVVNLNIDKVGTLQMTGQQAAERNLDDERLARAIEQSQAFFWGNSAYAVLFCLLRDEYGIAENMSMFEAKVEALPYSAERSYTCPKGTIVNAFSNNPIYRQPIDKWKDKANTRIMKLLDELKRQLEL